MEETRLWNYLPHDIVALTKDFVSFRVLIFSCELMVLFLIFTSSGIAFEGIWLVPLNLFIFFRVGRSFIIILCLFRLRFIALFSLRC